MNPADTMEMLQFNYNFQFDIHEHIKSQCNKFHVQNWTGYFPNKDLIAGIHKTKSIPGILCKNIYSIPSAAAL